MDNPRFPGLVYICGFSVGRVLLLYLGARWRNGCRVVRPQTYRNGSSVMVLRASVVPVHSVGVSIHNSCRAQRKCLTSDISRMAEDLQRVLEVLVSSHPNHCFATVADRNDPEEDLARARLVRAHAC